jgi:hypothetical protein
MIVAMLLSAAAATTSVDGVTVLVSIVPGPATTIELRLNDGVDKVPLRRAEPLAWITPDEPTLACPASITKAVNASITSREISLNSVRVVAAFADGSLAVLDPQTAFGGTQLESAADLGAPLRALSIDDRHGRIAMLTTTGRLSVAAGAGPIVPKAIPMAGAMINAAIAWSADGDTLWVAQSDVLSAINPQSGSTLRAHRLSLGPNPVVWTGSDASVLAGGAMGSVVLLPRSANAPIVLKGVAGIRSAAFGAKAASWLIASSEGQLVKVAQNGATTPVATVSNVRAAAFDSQGRLALVIADDGKTLALIDTADDRILDQRPLETLADRITTSDRFAYVHSGSSGTVDLISFEVARQEHRIATVTVPFGEATAHGAAPFARIGIMPGGAVVAGNDGRTLYAYAEGMMVPMGSLGGASRPLAGVAVIDRSLKEVEPGVYRAQAVIPYGGRYRLPIRLGQPRVDACVTIDIPGPPRPQLAVRANDAMRVGVARLGTPVSVILNAAIDVPQVIALATDTNGQWQRHFVLKRTEKHVFRGEVRFAKTGRFMLVARDARMPVIVAEARP